MEARIVVDASYELHGDKARRRTTERMPLASSPKQREVAWVVGCTASGRQRANPSICRQQREQVTAGHVAMMDHGDKECVARWATRGQMTRRYRKVNATTIENQKDRGCRPWERPHGATRNRDVCSDGASSLSLSFIPPSLRYPSRRHALAPPISSHRLLIILSSSFATLIDTLRRGPLPLLARLSHLRCISVRRRPSR